MPFPPEAFVHVPVLRGAILDPDASSMRLSHAALEAWDERLAEAGHPANWRRSHEDREKTRRAALARRPGGDLWVFAYGSLMWDPAIRLCEIRRATLRGFHRRFCLKIEIGRGSPEAPALMAALDLGGECQGLAFRIPAALVESETEILWMREMICEGYRPRFLATETPQGEIAALAFVMDRSCPGYADLSEAEAAAIIARGTGVLGTNLDYFERLAEKVAALGIADSVFEEIGRRLCGASRSA